MNESPLKYITTMLDKAVAESVPLEIRGRIVEVSGTMVRATIPGVRIGEMVTLRNPDGSLELKGEVVGLSGQMAVISPLGKFFGLASTTEVTSSGHVMTAPAGPEVLGRVLDGLGRPIDEEKKGPLAASQFYPVFARPPNPLKRRIIDHPVTLGLRVLDGMLTCGQGQRMGVFAAAGVGKSTLLAQIVGKTDAEIVVIALIGERGREVREFLERDLGAEAMQRSVAVVSTSDRPAMERLKAAYVATAIAEYFRDSGRNVLLLMDSVTRFARAQREIGLSAGEPPTRRGFPPSVFEALPQLMERAGQSDRGSITALYTVLVEGDDMTEPVADETRSILDGHIVLSRDLAAANHYPAVDVLASVSRVMSAIVNPEHREAAGKLRRMLARYKEVQLLVRLGEYKKGNDPETDDAIERMDRINAFLGQDRAETSSFKETVQKLIESVS